MGENSKIEWCHHTFNPWRGCTKVSPGCANCYAETMSHRNPAVLGEWGPNGKRVIAAESYWVQPIKWNREALMAGERRRVFCASLADVFEDRPELDEPRSRLMGKIACSPNLDWLLLTKRPQDITPALKRLADRYAGYGQFAGTLVRSWLDGTPPANVWLGVSVEDQARADERIPHLLRIPAAIRFLSCEPLLGPVDLTRVRWQLEDSIGVVCGGVLGDTDGGQFSPRGAKGWGIHWVIAGGESGPGARPMHPDWARSLRDQCREAGVSFHFKQWGEWAFHCRPTDADELVQACLRYPNGRWVGPNGESKHINWDVVHMVRAGKKLAGRLLDGVEHNEFPTSEAAHA